MGFSFLAYPGSLCPALEYAMTSIINKKTTSMSFIKINLKRKKVELSNSSTSIKIGLFENQEKKRVLTLLDVELRNCKTPQEGMMLLTEIQSLTLKYMAQYTLSVSPKEKTKTLIESPTQDGGVIYK